MAAFSWKRGLKHAVLPFLLVIVAAGVVFAVRPPKNPEKFGEGIGQLAAVIGALAFGASYLGQTGRRVGAILLSIVIVGSLGALAAVFVIEAPKRQVLSEADRRSLVESSDGGERWLRHPTLGFAIHHPGEGFAEAPQFASMLEAKGGGDDTVYYAYADAQPTAVLVVGVALARIDSSEDFARTVDDIESGIRDSAAKQAPDAKLEVVEHTIDWDSGRDARIHVVFAGAHMRLHVFARKRVDGASYVVILGAMSQSADALDNVIRELR